MRKSRPSGLESAEPDEQRGSSIAPVEPIDPGDRIRGGRYWYRFQTTTRGTAGRRPVAPRSPDQGAVHHEIETRTDPQMTAEWSHT